MKIAYVLNGIAPGGGGIEKITATKANYLAGTGNEVYLIVSDGKGVDPSVPLENVTVIDTGVKLYEYDFKPGLINFIRGKMKVFTLYRRLRKTLNEINPDILISVGQSEKFLLPILAHGKPWHTIREYHFARNYRQSYAGKNIRKLILAWVGYVVERFSPLPCYDITVVLTHQDFEENWGSSPSVRVIPNPTRLFDCKPSPMNNKRVISISRIQPIKRIEDLIEAWAIIHQQVPDWELEVWGNGPANYTRKLQNRIEQHHLSGCVHLRGRTENVQEALQSASLFAFASAHEGFGLVLIEAMSCGLPCVSYTCPCGPKDLISDGVDGLWVKNGDVQDMADKLLMLIRDEDKRKRMGKAAIEKSKQYSMEKIGQMWLALFEELVSKPKQ